MNTISNNSTNLNHDEIMNYYKFSQTIKYENRLVAYLDVLGWKSFINQSTSDNELMEKMGLGLYFVKKRIEEDRGKYNSTQITQFSDSLLISDVNIISFFYCLQDILQTYIRINGFLFRGAITKGNIFHNESLVYGPALLKVHHLEKSAIFPRLIIDPESELVPILKYEYQSVLREDKDKQLFFDFLQPFFFKGMISFDERLLNSAYDTIEKGRIKYSHEPKILEKYEWFAKYYNIIASEANASNPNTKFKLI